MVCWILDLEAVRSCQEVNLCGIESTHCSGSILGKEPTSLLETSGWNGAFYLAHKKRGKESWSWSSAQYEEICFWREATGPTFQPEIDTNSPWLDSWIFEILYGVNPSNFNIRPGYGLGSQGLGRGNPNNTRK